MKRLVIFASILAVPAVTLTACEPKVPLVPAHPTQDPRCKPGMPNADDCNQPPDPG